MHFLQITALLTLLAPLGLAQGDNGILVNVNSHGTSSVYYPESGICTPIGVNQAGTVQNSARCVFYIQPGCNGQLAVFGSGVHSIYPPEDIGSVKCYE
ncbi:uncharacterized protein ATNIH1004_001530 [Aspergillus tanneri]|uniref:Uncharacterized protein n=1 Tax=Aspergillus tanneri TaxID=1220188 RepID=A0A5M9MZT4_9EURO|nr:uncharacterized protein ATNIH1004_001530 [Aspergillus tanneri]KAA8652625.1 hypothetical protein ATNIH1004_001530 [Aspergillus tanneri]